MAYMLDISQYMEPTSGPLTDDQVQRCYARGIDRWAISLINQDRALRQLDVLHKHPVVIETFTAYDLDTYRQQQDRDLKFIEKIRREFYSVQRHWIDVEEPGFEFNKPEENIVAIEWLWQSFLNFVSTGIYTSNYMWNRCTRNTTQFAHQPLWFAAWNGRDTLIVTPPFGGWSQGEVHQTLNDLFVEGVWCDTNYYEPASPPVITPVPPVLELDLSKVRIVPEGPITVDWTDQVDKRRVSFDVRLVSDQ